MDGATIKDGGIFGGKHSRYMYFKITIDREWRAFSVDLPDVEINGNTLTLGEIKFVRTTETVWEGVGG